MSNPFKAGDTVTFKLFSQEPANHPTRVTMYKAYNVLSTTNKYVRFIGDDGSINGWYYDDLELIIVTKVQASLTATQLQASCKPPATYIKQIVCDGFSASDDVPEELSYEEQKATARVTSVGSFNEGDVLVYRDGTATQTTLTVARCTATCVWFEETYSMPFLPSDFKRT